MHTEPAGNAPVVIQPGQGVRLGWLIGLTESHVVLGVLCKESRWIGFAHAMGTLAFGMYLVVAGRSREQVACWVAYAVGAEVLWRMSDDPLPWEYAKYTVSLVMLTVLVRQGIKRFVWVPILYFVFLVPGAAVTLSEQPFSIARQYISFNLSGPLCVAVCALFFSQVSLHGGQIQRLLSWLVAPISGIAGAALFGLLTHTDIQFGSSSNFAASGGFGPNQVSACLGLGALYLVLMALSLRLHIGLHLMVALMAVWFCAHAALSFSRSGIYLFGAALLAAMPFLSLRRLLHPLTLAAACLAILAGVGAWGYMDHLTGGKLSERFASLSTSGRDRIAAEDLSIWREHPILGAGLGMSKTDGEAEGGPRAAAHTEYTRLLADHGLLGMFALFLLLASTVVNALRRRPGFAKPVVIAGTAWAILYLAVSGIRTAAPAFLIGLGFAQASALPILAPRRRRGVRHALGAPDPVVGSRELIVDRQWSVVRTP